MEEQCPQFPWHRAAKFCRLLAGKYRTTLMGFLSEFRNRNQLVALGALASTRDPPSDRPFQFPFGTRPQYGCRSVVSRSWIGEQKPHPVGRRALRGTVQDEWAEPARIVDPKRRERGDEAPEPAEPLHPQKRPEKLKRRRLVRGVQPYQS